MLSVLLCGVKTREILWSAGGGESYDSPMRPHIVQRPSPTRYMNSTGSVTLPVSVQIELLHLSRTSTAGTVSTLRANCAFAPVAVEPPGF